MSRWTASGQSHGFWSISVYNAAGYFEPNDRGAYTINITATPNDNGSITVRLGSCGDGRPNCPPIMDGSNYLVRLYRPRAEILDGTRTFVCPRPVRQPRLPGGFHIGHVLARQRDQ